MVREAIANYTPNGGPIEAGLLLGHDSGQAQPEILSISY